MNKPQTSALALLVAVATALATGCGGGADNQAQQDVAESAAWESQTAGEGPAERPAAPPAETGMSSFEPPAELSAAHILIMHKDSERAPAEITRTKEEALALVQEIALKVEAEGADFAALAKEYSDCPSGSRGGDLGNFSPGQMVRPFSEATAKLAVGEVSDPVETPFGYHIIRRQEIQVIPKASAKHILVQYQGSMQASADITRTKEEAEARIQECLKRAIAGDKFEDLAREFSDCPSKAEGGDLGEFPQGAMHSLFEEAAFACEVGKITDVIETPFGYHIIYRYK